MNILVLWNMPLVLAAVPITVVLAVALPLAASFPRSAATRNCILLPALVVTLFAPLIPLVSHLTGSSVDLAILHSVTDESPPQTASHVQKPVTSNGNTQHIETSNHDSPITPISFAPATGTDHLRIQDVLLGTWMLGSFIGVLGLIIAVRRLRTLVNSVAAIPEFRFKSAIARARRNLGIQQFPQLGITNRVSTPVAVVSKCKALILLPTGYLEDISDDQLVQVLTHEGAHITRGDPRIRLMQRVSLALWWWHPLIHVMNRQLTRAREDLCDNIVLSKTDAVDYGQTLLECGRRHTPRLRPAVAVALLGSEQSLEDRIRDLINPRRNTMIRSRPSYAVCSLLVMTTLIFLGGAVRVTEHNPSSLPVPLSTVDMEPLKDNGQMPVDNGVYVREFTLAFDNATVPGHLDVDIKRGSIRVRAHDDGHVTVKLTVPGYYQPPATRGDGLKVVRATPLDFDVRTSGQTIELNSDSYRYATNLEISVPRQTNLTLDSYQDGLLEVAGVSGKLRVRSNYNDIRLTDVAGSADVYGYQGSLMATFTTVSGPLEFETYNGEIDLTLPANLAVTTRVKTRRGQMLTDFQIAQRDETMRVISGENGGMRLDSDDFIVGDINGGGVACTFETTNGDITLRQRSR